MTMNSENNGNPVLPSQMVLPTVDVQYLFRFERTLSIPPEIEHLNRAN